VVLVAAVAWVLSLAQEILCVVGSAKKKKKKKKAVKEETPLSSQSL